MFCRHSRRAPAQLIHATSSWSYPPVSSWPPRFRTRTRWLKTTRAAVTPEASDGDTTGRTWNRRIRNPLLLSIELCRPLERPPGFEPGISTMARWRDSQLRYGRILGAKVSNLYFQSQSLACYRYTSPHRLAPPPGFEPGTARLTVACSTN